MNDNHDIPTYESQTGAKSSIDLTLISYHMTPIANNWRVIDEESDSDYKYIGFTINSKLNEIIFKTTFKYNTNNTDFKALQNDFNLKCDNILQLINQLKHSTDLDYCVTKIMDTITNICDRLLNKRKSNSRCDGKKWWTRELTAMRSELNRKRRQYQRTRCQIKRSALIEEYHSLRFLYQKSSNNLL
jgi:hypothetical protein